MQRWLIITAVLLSTTASAQINYGREDCGPVFEKWISDLENVKSLCQGSVHGPALEAFQQWIGDAQKEIRESKFVAIHREPIRYERPLFSVLDVIDRYGRMSSYETPMDASLFFTYYNSADDREKNIYKTLSFLTAITWFERELERSGRMHFQPSVTSLYSFTENAATKNEHPYFVSSEYKYFLDIVEDNRIAEFKDPMTAWKEELTTHFTQFTRVKPPAWSDKAALDQYLEIFAQPILYALGRLMLFNKDNPYYIDMESRPDLEGDNRFSADYFNKLFVAAFKNNIEALILHLADMKRMYCAATNINELGKITAEVETTAAEQVKPVEIKVPTSRVSFGMARLLIVAKTSKGRLLNSYDHYIFDLHKNNEKNSIKLAVNAYGEIPPGHYTIYNGKRPYESVEVSLSTGQTASVDYVPSSAVRAYYIKPNGQGIPLDFRIDFLLPKGDSYDTVYYDLIRGGKEMEVNPRLYYVRALLPPRFYPPSIGVDVTTEANSLSTVSVAHYGMLSVETYDGMRQPKNVSVNVYGTKINPETGLRKLLTSMNSQYGKTGRNDTLFLEPGIYWIAAQYLFPVGREVQITSDYLTLEPIENLGSLLVTNSTNSTEVIEVTDLKTNKTKNATNNVPVDLLTDRKYRVKIIGGKNLVFNNVVVKPGQQTTVRW